MGTRNKKQLKSKLQQPSELHPDHQALIPRLRKAQGQVEAVARMIYAREYCPNIVQQLRAASSALRALEASLLQTHIEHCVRDAMGSKNQKESQEKINELIALFKRGTHKNF